MSQVCEDNLADKLTAHIEISKTSNPWKVTSLKSSMRFSFVHALRMTIRSHTE